MGKEIYKKRVIIYKKKWIHKTQVQTIIQQHQ